MFSPCSKISWKHGVLWQCQYPFKSLQAAMWAISIVGQNVRALLESVFSYLLYTFLYTGISRSLSHTVNHTLSIKRINISLGLVIIRTVVYFFVSLKFCFGFVFCVNYSNFTWLRGTYGIIFVVLSICVDYVLIKMILTFLTFCCRDDLGPHKH